MDGKAHHYKDIYEAIVFDHSELLTRNFINQQFSAFSLLEFLFKDKFQFSRPYISNKGIEIGRVRERLYSYIYSNDEILISDIKDFANKLYYIIYSLIELINNCNDEFLLVNDKKLKRISLIGVNEEIALEVENIIESYVSETIPISEILVWDKLPRINEPWTEWLIYSVINKWGKKLEVAMSTNKFKKAIPLISPLGKMETSGFKDLKKDDSSELIKIDDLDNIDELLEDIIDDEFSWEEI